MLVRQCFTELRTDENGNPYTLEGDRWIEIDGVVTEAEAIALEQAEQAARAVAEHNAEIQAQLDAADLKIVRAVLDGDTARIEAHKASQAALRAQLIR